MNLSTQLHETAAKFTSKPAFVFMDQETSYTEFDHAVTRFADGLQSLGIKKGDNVALLLGNSPHFIIGLYGLFRLGATAIPINPTYTPDEISYILTNGDVKAVIMLDLLIPMLEKIDRILPNIGHYIICPSESSERPVPENLSISSKMKSFTKVFTQGTGSLAEPATAKEDTAIILYTSGTTGKPKGAMLSYGNLYSNACDVADYLGINEDDRVITVLPMFHVFCLTVCLNAPLLNGGTLYIIPQFSPKEVFHVARKYEITLFAGVPTMFNYLLQYPEGNAEDFQSLRFCISGGSAMPVALLKNFEEKFNVIVSEGYGLSEAAPVTCFNPIDRPRKPGSIGKSIIHVENKVVNELGEEVPPGQVGELIVKGPNVMKGYYKLPEETSAALKDGWLYTGDLARMDDEGYFYIVDRKKDMVIVGGFNVYPREVEEVLFAHPEIAEVAVIGAPDPNLGEVIRCFVVAKRSSLTEEELIDYCKERLAKYKVPKSIDFMEELPKNTTGKILRRALKNAVLQQS